MVNTVLSTALSGMSRAAEQVERGARALVNGSVDESGGSTMPEDIVDIKIGEASYEANLAVIEVADDMQEALLNSFDEEV